jgi:hypothetical protein
MNKLGEMWFKAGAKQAPTSGFTNRKFELNKKD